jgi:hypothetical protein
MELSKELRERAESKPDFHILMVTDGESRLSTFRGESIIKEFNNFYRKHANIEFATMSPARAAKLTRSDIANINLIYLDSTVDSRVSHAIAGIQKQIIEEIEPNYVEELEKLTVEDAPIREKAQAIEIKINEAQQKGEDPTALVNEIEELKSQSKSEQYVLELDKKRQMQLRVIYGLDEFVWQAPAGRVCNLGTVFSVEAFMEISDTVVVPDANMADAMTHFGYVSKSKEIFIVPTAASQNFFPIMRDFSKKFSNMPDKPRVLVKGITLSEGVQDFVAKYYKQFDLTISSVGELSDHVMALIQHKKVGHINHFANPQINKGNREIAYAVERDLSYDFVVYCEDPEIQNDFYSITSGDEDVLFAIASGSVPVCGVDHVGYDNSSLYFASGLHFNPKEDTGRDIYEIIKRNATAVKWNEAFAKARGALETRISNAPSILAKYWQVFLGKELTIARQFIAEEARQEMETDINEDAKKNVEDLEQNPDNIIEGKFGGTP